MPVADKQKSALLEVLPPEVTMIIWRDVLATEGIPVHLLSARSAELARPTDSFRSLSLTSRRIRNESKEVFFDNSTFILHFRNPGETSRDRSFTERVLKSIVDGDKWCLDHLSLKWLETVDRDFFGRIRHLRLVFQTDSTALQLEGPRIIDIDMVGDDGYPRVDVSGSGLLDIMSCNEGVTEQPVRAWRIEAWHRRCSSFHNIAEGVKEEMNGYKPDFLRDLNLDFGDDTKPRRRRFHQFLWWDVRSILLKTGNFVHR